MAPIFRGMLFDRDRLPEAMTKFSDLSLQPTSLDEFVNLRPPARGGSVGSWSSTSGDPLAEILVVRDSDFQDTLHWLNSYFAGLSPVTQWCRVLSLSQAEHIASRAEPVGLGHMLGAWVGAVIAECSVQAGGIQNLRDMTGSAATSSATFAAGRAVAVWQRDSQLGEIARRHDELSQHLREGGRPVSAASLSPIWTVLSGHEGKLAASDRRALDPLIQLVALLAENERNSEPAEMVTAAAEQARIYFDLPEIAQCAEGPQVERVRALDRLGERLATGPRSPVVDALLGLGASFVDPGSAVAPELLRRYTRLLPTAPIWQGLFAGIITPLRVLTDQAGLGRLIAKALVAPHDLYGRPSCDIAYDELTRWITPGRSIKVDVRGMSARALAVELSPGVTCTFAYNRLETPPSLAKADLAKGTTENRSTSGTRTLQDLELVVMNLQRRIERIETGSIGSQRSLDLAEPKEGKNRKGSGKKG